jgi:hypothetical protein
MKKAHVELDSNLLGQAIHSIKKNLSKSDKKYYEGKEWVCDKSPTGAHYWIEKQEAYSYPIVMYHHICKHCGKEKKICKM